MKYVLSPYVTVNVAVVEISGDPENATSKAGPPVQAVVVPLSDLEGCAFYDQLLTLPNQVAAQVATAATAETAQPSGNGNGANRAQRRSRARSAAKR